MEYYHQPVLLDEVVRILELREKRVVVDATLGLGGHAEAILSCERFQGKLIGVDRDAESLALARKRLEHFGERFLGVQGSFAELKNILTDFDGVDGLLFDLGISSYQLQAPGRGFSFDSSDPLDMRMDRSQGESAAEILQRAGEQELFQIFRSYGEERYAKRIAQGIVRERSQTPLTTSRQLAELVKQMVRSGGRIHPATRIFQALRIAVNQELEQLSGILEILPDLLQRNGRAVFISFHSLEDRLIKHALKRWANDPRHGKNGPLMILTPKPIVPTAEECRKNPRARSAKLRAAERI